MFNVKLNKTSCCQLLLQSDLEQLFIFWVYFCYRPLTYINFYLSGEWCGILSGTGTSHLFLVFNKKGRSVLINK